MGFDRVFSQVCEPPATASVVWTALPEGRSPSKKQQGEGRPKMVSKGAGKKSSSKRDVSEVRRPRS